jgi:hypothetical protein
VLYHNVELIAPNYIRWNENPKGNLSTNLLDVSDPTCNTLFIVILKGFKIYGNNTYTPLIYSDQLRAASSILTWNDTMNIQLIYEIVISSCELLCKQQTFSFSFFLMELKSTEHCSIFIRMYIIHRPTPIIS